MATSPVTVPESSEESLLSRLRAGDPIAQTITGTAAAFIVVVTVILAFNLWTNSEGSRLAFGWGFITSTAWDPVREHFGALPFIYGTITTSLLALAIAVPAGLGAAIFLAELAPRGISDALTFTIELLAAVPSVIYGLLGIFLLVPALRSVIPQPFAGVSIFTAGVILAVMIVPFIVSVSREVLLAVPQDQREAALALGATRWETTWRVVVPYATRGIMGSVFLALARALGETMAVTMVIGNRPEVAGSLLDPGYSIAAVIANEFSDAAGLHQQALIEMGLVLFALTIVINGVARVLVHSINRAPKGAH